MMDFGWWSASLVFKIQNTLIKPSLNLNPKFKIQHSKLILQHPHLHPPILIAVF
jgi:hypothetical protein